MRRAISFAAAALITLCLTVGAHADFDMITDYSELMIDAATSGDTDAGNRAEAMRNEKIDALGLTDQKISYEDLFLLAKVIHAEAGSAWLPEEWKMCVGEVLLNRVASPEFPDTLEKCVYQPGQYCGTDDGYFDSLVPYRSCAEAAERLLSGERILNDPTVVFQANGPQGGGVCREFYDSYFGTTYLCYTNHPDLYAG